MAERYEISTPLGQGGGGVVCLARDVCSGVDVAVKRLRTLSGPAEVEALVQEATSLSGLEGLGFPRVWAFGRTADGQAYVVRELVEGTSLDVVAEEDPERAVRVLPALADALTVAHRSGLLHGDVKPHNAIVRADGSVAWVDWGLAVSFGAGGPVRGFTPRYAAPELLAGAAPSVRSEVYALGVVLRDLLADGRAFARERETRAELEAIVTRAAAREPASRYPSVGEFGAALDRALGIDGISRPRVARPWPLLDAAERERALSERLERLEPGGQLLVDGAAGSGRSTLLRRLAFRLELSGHHVALLDEAAWGSPQRERIVARALRPGGVVLVDVADAELGALRERAREAGTKLVALGEGPGEVFEVEPLAEGIIRALLRGALPSLPSELVPEVEAQTGGNPLRLRMWVEAADGRPIASPEDVRAVLGDAVEDESDPVAFVERSLDRGHYASARPFLGRLPHSAHGLAAWARYELQTGSAARAEELAEQALGLPAEPALRERLQVLRARAVLGSGDYPRALQLLEAAADFAQPARAEGWAYRGLLLSFLGRGSEGLQVAEAAERQAREQGEPRVLSIAAAALGSVELRAGEPERAEASYRRALDAARVAGDLGMLASTQINLAGLAKERGDLATSIALLEGAEGMARQASRRASVEQALLNLTNLDLYLGRTERARAALARLGDPAWLSPPLRAQRLGLLAELLARAGERERALEQYDACALAFEALGRLQDAGEAWLEPVITFAPGPGRSGLPLGELTRRVARGEQLLGGADTPLSVLARAVLEAARGDAARAEAAVEKAAELAEARGQREWRWRALALGAELHEAAGRTTRAERQRAAATELLEEIAAHLPTDLREVFWNDPRRRALAPGRRQPSPSLTGTVEPAAGTSRGTGTDWVSRLSQTPLEQRLARILAINSDLSSESNLERLTTKIVGHAAELLGAERGYLLLGRSAAELTIQASRAAHGEDHRHFSRSIASRVLETGQPLVSVDAEADQRLSSFASVHAAAISAVACVPVRAPDGQPIGALYLETRLRARPDFADELPILQAFADQAAIALENARLLEELSLQKRLLEERNQALSESRERLREVLERRTERLREARKELRGARDRLAAGVGFRGLVGQSAAMRRIYALIERVQETDVPVLITGESGTGKEVVARAIHEGSGRRERPWLAVNCGAIPESILESELFGHVRGAFTGAERDRKGLFVAADRGTLFLDEIGETPLKMQASLLRVLQERRVRPVGGTEELPIDVRVIFATNRRLEDAVASGRFREDLLFRIQVVELHLPPLRERREDIPLLIDHFLERLAQRFRQPRKTLSRPALARLSEHPLPGNVRQLENLLQSAWVISDGQEIDVDDFTWPRAPGEPSAERSPSRAPPSAAPSSPGARPGEREQIIAALERTGGNRVRAAEVLSMPRRTFYRRLREYGIQ